MKSQRQASILSFLHKPSPENHAPVDGSSPSPHALASKAAAAAVPFPRLPPMDAPPTISNQHKADFTPPETEKPPRHLFPSASGGTLDSTPSPTSRSSLFSSIMHKFVKVDEQSPSSPSFGSGLFSCADPPDGSLSTPASSVSDKFNRRGIPVMKPIPFNNSMNTHEDDNMVGPETRVAERPFVPRLKWILEDGTKLDRTRPPSASGLRDSSGKRLKFLQEELKPVNNLAKSSKEDLQTASKFLWLHPHHIRDANRRRPCDPLFDKRTLYIPPDVFQKLSASQKQYWSVKCQYMDVLLFFKVGKFYELYEIDAEIGHKELDWKMTYSGVGKCRQVGITESAIDDAVQKLVARGYKVGRIEQLETSDQAKSRGANSVIQRKLVHVIGPSTTVDENISPDAVHLLSIKEVSSGLDHGTTVLGFAFVDCAALKIWIGSVTDDVSCAALGSLLMQVSPKEIIYESRGLSKEAQKALKKYSSAEHTQTEMTPVNPVHGFLDANEVKNQIQSNHYFKESEKLWDNLFDGVTHHEVTLCALGGLIDQLSRLMMDDILRNGDVLPYQVYKGCLRMDGQSMVNLEIFSNNSDGGSAGTLYKYLDNCITSSGKRLLRSWICHPLKDVDGITNRLNLVDCFIEHPEMMLVTANYLRKIPDLERLLGRVRASVRSSATLLLPLVGKKVFKQRVKAFGTLVKGLKVAMDLLIMLQKESIISLLLKILELPMLGGQNSLDEFLTQFEAAIDNDFPRYQDHDPTDSDAETLTILIELFVERANHWSQVVYAISCVDVLRSFATMANESSGPMCRPLVLPLSTSATSVKLKKGPTLKIKGLWHPFAVGENGVAVPNDLYLGGDENGQDPHTLLLTGPNMGGKSTLLRAACLAVILAQLGCYVPSISFELSLVDTIFTRLGATDRIMTGESTFYIECAETASVLQNATRDSLVLLDELGRGTSTFDGYAIAYAVFRHLIEKVNCRLLFATHYHPLTKEFSSHPHVSLKHMACTFGSTQSQASSADGVKGELVFLYQLAAGACPESYGLQVALKAGLPKQVVDAAKGAGQVMKEIMKENFKSSEKKAEFSTLHEMWLKSLLSVSKNGENGGSDDEDIYDTLFCIWYELKSSYA